MGGELTVFPSVGCPKVSHESTGSFYVQGASPLDYLVSCTL